MESDRGMRILLATDGSTGAAVAERFVAHLALRSTDEVIVVAHPSYLLAARPDGTGLIGHLMEGRRREAHRAVAEVVDRFAEHGIAASGVVQDGLDAVESILRVAHDRRADLIVVGSRGLGRVGSAIVGSTARALAMTSPVPVLVAREASDAPRRALIAADGSPASNAAIAAFSRLPIASELGIEVIHVLPDLRWEDVRAPSGDELASLRESVERDELQRARTLLQRSASRLGPHRAIQTTTARGAVSDEILRRADAVAADLIVLGTRGFSGPRQLFWGSTAERVLSSASCSVLVAPPAVASVEALTAEASRETVAT